MQPRDGDGLASACCNWEARCSSRSNSLSIDFLPSSIVVKTLASPGDIPDLSAIGNGESIRERLQIRSRACARTRMRN
jgi:hypothetical protein